MSLKETMEAEVKRLGEVHEQNRVKYRAALKAKNEANAIARIACKAASDSANELGAAQKALDELNRTSPKRTVSGEGAVQAAIPAGDQ